MSERTLNAVGVQLSLEAVVVGDNLLLCKCRRQIVAKTAQRLETLRASGISSGINLLRCLLGRRNIKVFKDHYVMWHQHVLTTGFSGNSIEQWRSNGRWPTKAATELDDVHGSDKEILLYIQNFQISQRRHIRDSVNITKYKQKMVLQPNSPNVQRKT